MANKIALITGITGQDGAYLARFLKQRGYDVHGVRPYSATHDLERLDDELLSGIHLHTADMADTLSLTRILKQISPDEVYNLAAQSHVAVSFLVPEQTADVNGLGPVRMLEAIRMLGMESKIRFYQASSSEMFGNAAPPQSEKTPFAPCSPYAVAKLYAYWMVNMYRQAYGMYAVNGVLFNHESPLRGECFVSRKIARAVARREPLVLGNLNSSRDWGHAHDYVRGMWMIMQQDQPDDYVLATGQMRSVRDFVEAAYRYDGIDIVWSGEGLAEQGSCKKTGKLLISVDQKYFRPTEVNTLWGDASKAREQLGWEPEISFDDLVAEMVDAERNGDIYDLLAAE